MLINNPKELATEFNNFLINSVNEITMFSPSVSLLILDSQFSG